MRQSGQVIGIAVPFVWLGMVLAISFLETPLKFRAPGITLPIGLGIGRLVFRALNLAEVGLAILLTLGCLALQPPPAGWALVAAGWVLLAVQMAALRPRLDRRALLIIAGRTPSGSRQHLAYIAMEVIKIVLLAVLGSTLTNGALA